MSSTVTIKQKSEYYYLKCVLEREESDKMTCIILEPVKLRSLIGTALKQLHGLVGASITVDVLKCEQSNGEIILRVKANNLVKVWSSLTLFSNYNGSECRFRVKQVSPYLMSLATDSRTWSPFEADNINQPRYFKTF
ncbi:ribonuclease P protein subunit p14-like [Dendronephthya gigantea]|uniref:ribonuclease P protein subunit p14-like n=1 Tax=Dendronephthya gigantea TaxID=151771 RepID=UPI00106D1ED6|nr:ribonuclease P protein subunit p14-like [Dendronephthya gigantea]